MFCSKLALCVLVLVGVTASMEVPEYVMENVNGDDFQMGDILGSGMAEDMVMMEKSKESADEMKKMVCKDMNSTEDSTEERGRSLEPGFCFQFCLDFFNWCRERVCGEIVKYEKHRLFERLTCRGTCAMFSFSCCIT